MGRHPQHALAFAALASCLLFAGGLAAADDNVRGAPISRLARREMTEREIRGFLSQPRVARLATVRPDGTPQITPMWFLFENRTIYMSTRTGAGKVTHIRRNPNVAAVVDVMEAPYRNKVVELEGTAEIETEDVTELTAKIRRKYVGAQSAQGLGGSDTGRVILKFSPRKIRSLDTTR